MDHISEDAIQMQLYPKVGGLIRVDFDVKVARFEIKYLPPADHCPES